MSDQIENRIIMQNNENNDVIVNNNQKIYNTDTTNVPNHENVGNEGEKCNFENNENNLVNNDNNMQNTFARTAVNQTNNIDSFEDLTAFLDDI